MGNTTQHLLNQESEAGKSNVKTMLIVFFNIDGLVHHEYIPRGQTVNKEFYKTVLQCLRNAVRRPPWEVAFRQLNPAPWQCPYSQGHHHKWISGETQHSVPPTPSPLPWPHSVRFPQLKKTMKGRDLIMLKRLRPTWQDKWGLLQKVTTRGAFISGRNAGISAHKDKDTTLKETRTTSR